MDSKNLLQKYYSRLAKEGLIKALMLGLIVGFSVLLISSAIWWLAELKGLWLCAIFFVVATAGTTPIFYYKVFRPTIKQTAKRIDALGLEERLLTMTELERETSFIAMRQREDAAATLKTVNEKLLKFTVSISLIITLAIVTVFGTGMLTVAAFVDKDDISGTELKKFEIVYKVQGKGDIEGESLQVIKEGQNEEGVIIEGKIFQVVEEGQNAPAVMAVPEDNWVFAGWSDGYGDPFRVDIEVSKNMTVYAIFEDLSETEEQDSEEGKDGTGEADSEGVDPGADTGTEPNTTPGGDGGGEGGSYEERNQIKDNQTYYGGSTFDNAYNDAIEDMSKDDNASGEENDVIDEYFKTIKQ